MSESREREAGLRPWLGRYSSPAVEPDDLLSTDELSSLPQDEQQGYLEALNSEIERARASEDHGRLLIFANHFIQLAKWALPPDDFERDYRAPLWDGIWSNAEGLTEVFEGAANSPDFSPSEQARAAADAERLRSVVEHKRDLDELHGTAEG